jgi:hypothetical protein
LQLDACFVPFKQYEQEREGFVEHDACFVPFKQYEQEREGFVEHIVNDDLS